MEKQLLGAIETAGTVERNEGGVMDLPTIVSSSKQTTEEVESDGETEIERELRETIEGKF